MRRFGLTWLCLVLVACGAQPTSSPPVAAVIEPSDPHVEAFTIPVTDALGQVVRLQARLCRPASNAPARLVMINHGTPATPAARAGVTLQRCDSQVSRWFLSRGYAVGYVLRRGHGASGGAWAESPRPCTAASFAAAGIQATRDIAAALGVFTQQPGIRPDGVVMVGQSTGGWATDAFNSIPHPKVIAMVSMAGGHGGHVNNTPNNNCRPDQLAEAAGIYGRTATTPMLWVYTANDTFFAPPIAEDMYAHFTAAGGKAEFVQPGPFGNDGHNMFFATNGSAVWGPLIERYLAERGAGPG
jgi:dienelactone hydrolase